MTAMVQLSQLRPRLFFRTGGAYAVIPGIARLTFGDVNTTNDKLFQVPRKILRDQSV
jgi:hypothetical protein